MNDDPDTIALAVVLAAADGDWETAADLARAGEDDQPARTFADNTALAGDDGRDLNQLIREAQEEGVRTLADLCRVAVRRALAAGMVRGQLLDDAELMTLADVLAAANATADLLGRARTHELADRVDPRPFHTFADVRVEVMPPEAALDYFRTLVPSLSLDPERWGEYHRRHAFTLAESTNDVLTAKVQAALTEAIRSGRSLPDSSRAVSEVLAAAGVHPRNPQYAELVVRTNAMDAYTQAAYEEARSPALRGAFPVWQYLAIVDGRHRPRHGARHGRYYPAEAVFADVRGLSPGDVCNCRCNFRWVHADEWAGLQAQGARLEVSW